MKELVDQTDDTALTAIGVRWIPSEPFPLQRLISKYGSPTNRGVSDNDFQPYREWSQRGIWAYLSDDEKNVEFIDFSFTAEEQVTVKNKEARRSKEALKSLGASPEVLKSLGLDPDPPAPIQKKTD